MKLHLSVANTIRLLAVVVLAILSAAALASVGDSPVGLWKMIDDRNGTPRALIRVTEINGKFRGVIEKGLRPDDHDDAVCEKCEGPRHGQRLVGMVILTGIRKQGEAYGGGEIVDPDEGKAYRCKITVKDGGNTLQVRGFVGIEVFGRTQTWVRAE